MTLFQVVSVLFALWMVYELSIHARKKIITATEVGVWVGVWFTFIVVAIFPDLLIGIAHKLRFTRVFDMLIVIGLMILTILVFFSYYAQRASTKKLEKLVQDLAIREVQSSRKPKAHSAK